MSMPPKDNTPNPRRDSPHYTAPMFPSSPQYPSLRVAPRIWTVHEPSIADECGRHSDLPMDRVGATTGTRSRPTGWTPDPPVIPPAPKNLIVTTNRGGRALRHLVHVVAHTAAQGRTFLVHRQHHQTPFLSKSRHARSHHTGGLGRAGQTRFRWRLPKGGDSTREGTISYADYI